MVKCALESKLIRVSGENLDSMTRIWDENNDSLQLTS